MLLAGLALLPTIVLVAWIYRQDKVEKEPKGLLWKIFLFGVLSVIPAMILEIIFEEILLVFVEGYTLYYVILENFIGVALIEELCKRKAAKMAVWKHPAFNYKFDAIVYCVTSALGLATIENILYEMDADISTALTRAVLSVPSHATGIQNAVADCQTHKAVHDKYLKIGWKARQTAFAESHKDELDSFNKAFRYLKQQGVDLNVNLDSLQAEYDKLKANHTELAGQLAAAKEEL